MAKEVIALIAATALAGAAAAQSVEPVDLKKPERPVPGPGEAMIVLRPHASTMVGDNLIYVHRYDPAAARVVIAADGKPAGARINFSYTVWGGQKGARALKLAIVPAGDYVLAGRRFNGNYTDSFCFGAPRFTVRAGEIVYLGDFEMFALEKMADGERRNAMRYSADLAGARANLADFYPELAPRLTAWVPTNGATFRCMGDEFLAYSVAETAGPAAP